MNKDNYTIEMKALCKAIEQEADALPLIQRLLEEKHISADDLKTMLRDDHNMVDASVVHQLVKAGVFTKEELVRDCIKAAGQLGFRILQFNAVVESNIHARHLYERIGFKQLGVIPNGFRMKDGHFENICPYYIEL